MTPERIERTRRLGVLPIANPSFLYFLGKEVARRRSARRVPGMPSPSGRCSIADSRSPGAPMRPATGPSTPLRDLGTAVSRSTFNGLTLAPHERITMTEALRAQTVERGLGRLSGAEARARWSRASSPTSPYSQRTRSPSRPGPVQGPARRPDDHRRPCGVQPPALTAGATSSASRRTVSWSPGWTKAMK